MAKLKSGTTIGGSTAWHASNDGAGSGLDADLLDGQQGSYYQNASNLNAGTIADARISGAYTGMTNLTGSGTVDFANFLGNAADSVTAPSFSWTGDTNTGIYQPAADQLGITTGGIQRLTVSSSGLTVNSGRLNATEINGNAGQQLILFAGESAVSSGYTGLTNEFVYVVAESGMQIISSSNNWVDGGSGTWATRNTATINDSSGNSSFPGSITATGDVTAYSDERLKENIETITDAVSKVEQLRGVTYTRKSNGIASTGVIAQDVEKVLPQAVATDEDGMMSVKYGNMVGLLIEAIKELDKKHSAEIDAMKAEIAELKARLNN